MADFRAFLSAFQDGVRQLIGNTLHDFQSAAEHDVRAYLEQARADLERWVAMLAEDQLTRDEFEFLVKGRKDLAEMQALEQAGLALVRVDRFRDQLLDLVVGTAVNLATGL